MNNIQDAQIYVGTYAKYNGGSIFGEWLILSDYYDKEEFYEACRQLHADENDPEFMFQDHENIPEGLIGESWLSDNFSLYGMNLKTWMITVKTLFSSGANMTATILIAWMFLMSLQNLMKPI